VKSVHMAKNKPKTGALPLSGGPRIGANPSDTNKLKPVWSIVIFDRDGPWGKCKFTDNEHLWMELFPKLRDYERMTWGEIYKDKDKNHSVLFGSLVKEARDRLTELKLDDINELFRFRLSGKGRVWGIREGRVFKLLWWDPEHFVCPSILKHT
jgi:hypothetical protein